MKYLILLTVLFLHVTANGQMYINLEIDNGIATFKGNAETPGKQIGDLHALTLTWLDETFASEDVITLNTKTKISATYPATYTVQGNTTTFNHNLQFDFSEGEVLFLITDRSMNIVHANGDWKKHLSELRVKFEKGCNELLWSYSKYINEHEVKE
jgi:hypothetical protein